MRVREVMTGEVKTVAPDTSVFEVACIMRDEDIGSVPVAENDKLVGMVTDRDIVLRGVASGTSVEECTARDVMSQKILYVREDQDVEDVLQNMGDQQVRRMPVINSDMRLVGIVSLGDLSRKAKTKESGESLKEISQPTTGSKH